MANNFTNSKPGSGICPQCGAEGCGGWYPTVVDAEMCLQAECVKCGYHWCDNYTPDNAELSESEYCPQCEGHHTVVMDDYLIEGSDGSLQSTCENCGAGWTETFTYSYSEEL